MYTPNFEGAKVYAAIKNVNFLGPKYAKKQIIPTPVKEAIAKAKNNNLETKEVAKMFNVSERSVRDIGKIPSYTPLSKLIKNNFI